MIESEPDITEKINDNGKTYIGELQSGIVNLVISLYHSYLSAGFSPQAARTQVADWLQNNVITTLTINKKDEE